MKPVAFSLRPFLDATAARENAGDADGLLKAIPPEAADGEQDDACVETLRRLVRLAPGETEHCEQILQGNGFKPPGAHAMVTRLLLMALAGDPKIALVADGFVSYMSGGPSLLEEKDGGLEVRVKLPEQVPNVNWSELPAIAQDADAQAMHTFLSVLRVNPQDLDRMAEQLTAAGAPAEQIQTLQDAFVMHVVESDPAASQALNKLNRMVRGPQGASANGIIE